MMRKLAALTAFAFSSHGALAQTFTPNPDNGTYVARAATYAAGTAENVLGDGSDAKGGVAPMFTTHPEPGDPRPTLTPGDVVTDNTITVCTQPSVCDVIEPANLTTNPYGFEDKSRFLLAPTKVLCVDPLRFYGQQGVSHCHEFFGNPSYNAHTTFKSSRVRPTYSTAMGNLANLTGYWDPAVVKTISGKKYAIPAKLLGTYYSEDRPAGTPITDIYQYLHLLQSFILGVNMDDPNDTRTDNELAIANAQPGTAGRYTKDPSPRVSIRCVAPNGSPRALKSGIGYDAYTYDSWVRPDGGNPWEVSTGVSSCVDGDDIEIQSKAPACIDGWNVGSPSGYDHTRYPVYDNVKGKLVCPNGWYRQPTFIPGVFHTTRGWADYSQWRLDSDDMMQAKLTALGTPRTVRPGQSYHADWKNGWHFTTLRQWLDYCIKGHRTCNTGVIGPNKRLKAEPTVPTVDSNNPAQLIRIDTTRQPSHSMRGM